MDPLIFGKDPTPRIVGLHLHGDNQVKLYLRHADDDQLYEEEAPIYPFLFASNKGHARLLEGFNRAKHVTLRGGGHYRHLWVFDGWQDFADARRYVRQEEGSDPSLIYAPPSPMVQYLMQSGRTMFKGMSFEDIHRMQVDIETYAPGAFPNAERDPIIVVSLTDNRGFARVLFSRPRAWEGEDRPSAVETERGTYQMFETEEDLLWGFLKEIHARDPDVLELHNGFGFDLPYLRDRFAHYKIPFALGRNKQAPRTFRGKKKFAERDFEYENFDIPGRAVIDTMFLAVDRDVVTRDMPGIGLKEVARYFREKDGMSEDELYGGAREYVPGDEIARVWDEEPERLLWYALDDVIETRYIAGKLEASTFYLTQMLPMDYQRAHTAGTAGSIETLFVRAYLHARHSLPKPEEATQEHGGYTDLFHQGVVGPLVYADVTSLYPSIMLNYDVAPESDELGLFRHFLRALTDLRLATKKRMSAASGAEKENLDAEQSAYKLIINSFYGMLGFRFALFNDISEADRVALTGQSLLTLMMQIIADLGGTVIECDTDGVLYVPREDIRDDQDAQRAEVQEISRRMPDGINVDMDGLFERMLSYRKKNYVLKGYDGKVKVKGGSFKSRGIEAFGRDYVRRIVEALLSEDVMTVWRVHEEYKAKIVSGRWHVDEFKIRVGLKQSLDDYDEGREENENKTAQAQYEIARRLAASRGREARAGDVIEYFVGGRAKKSNITAWRDALPADEWRPGRENPIHYLKRLESLSKKFAFLFSPEDFGLVFDMTIRDPDQENLFGPFEPDLSGVKLVTTQVKPNVEFPA